MSEVIEREKKGLNSFILRIYAYVFTCLGMVFTYFPRPGLEFLRFMSWIAFPIFAFLLAEGFYKTSSKLRYGLRLLVFALISELPYNLLESGKWFYSGAQNGMFTLLIGWAALFILDEFSKRVSNIILNIAAIYLVGLGAYMITRVFHFQFYAYGMLLIIMFYVSKKISYPKLLHIAIFIMLVFVVTTTAYITFTLGKMQYTVAFRGFLIFALIPIWFYDGKRGPNSLPAKIGMYAFWPLLLIILAMVRML